MYYASHLDVFCDLCNQVAVADHVAELESIATRGLQERTTFKNLLEECRKETEVLRQHIMERERYHQVSKAGFSFNQIRIISFCPAFLKERTML